MTREQTSMTKNTRWLAWVILVVIAGLYIGFIANARGIAHHRGDEIGTHGTTIVVVKPAR